MHDELTSILTNKASRSKLASELDLASLDFLLATNSTQSIVRSLAEAGAPEWTTVATDHQYEGRGRHGRAWVDRSATAVMLSILLRPLSTEAMSLLPIRIGLAAAVAIESLTGEALMLKWPNDLVARDRKVGGILCEGIMRGSDLAVVAGIGINVASAPEEGGALPPIALTEVACCTRLALFVQLIRSIRLDLDLSSPSLRDEELDDYRKRDWLEGKTIDEPISGTVVGIDAAGRLVVRSASGVETAVAGSVRLAHS